MLRRLLIALSVLSLLLCVGTVGLWGRSHWVGDGFTKYAPGHSIEISSCRGQLWYYEQTDPPEFPFTFAQTENGWSRDTFHGAPKMDTGDETWFNRLGIAFEWRFKIRAMVFSDRPLFQTETRIIVPHWLVAAAFALLPTAWLLGAIRRRVHGRRVEGLRCVHCNYDIRFSETRCPECGTAITPPAR